MDQEQEIQAARDKLAARFNNATQIGGKGMQHTQAIRMDVNFVLTSRRCRYPEKKEEACYRPECQ